MSGKPLEGVLPQFGEEYDGLKMRVLVDKIEKAFSRTGKTAFQNITSVTFTSTTAFFVEHEDGSDALNVDTINKIVTIGDGTVGDSDHTFSDGPTEKFRQGWDSSRNQYALTNRGGVFNGSNEIYTVNFTSGDMKILSDLELDGALNHDGTTIGFYGTTPAVQSAAYTPTNVSTDRAYDADSTSVAELADVLGTLIADLKLIGVIG